MTATADDAASSSSTTAAGTTGASGATDPAVLAAESLVPPLAPPSSTPEMGALVASTARASGRRVLDAGRGQPNWSATVPRAAFFRLGTFAVADAAAHSDSEHWGVLPPEEGIDARLRAALAAEPSDAGDFLLRAVDFAVAELGYGGDAWVHELVKAVLGAGYPSPNRMLEQLENVVEHYYLVTMAGIEPGEQDRFELFATEGGAAAMSYVFASLKANELVGPGDAVAGNRLGFVALAADTVLDDLIAAQPEEVRARQQYRYGSMTSHVAGLSFMRRMVADSREVALHNIAGLSTVDQVQMGLFALTFLLPRGAEYAGATRDELGRRLDALYEALGVEPPGGDDSRYYALVDVLEVARRRVGVEAADRLRAGFPAEEVPLRLARGHGIIVQPGPMFHSQAWDLRVCLTALPTEDLVTLGRAVVSVVDDLVGNRAAAGS